MTRPEISAATFLSLVLSASALVGAQQPASVQGPPPQGMREDAQKRTQEAAQSLGADLAAIARATRVGTLSLDAVGAFQRWSHAVRVWKGEKGAGAAPLLADGVLFDCLDRFHGVRMPWLSTDRTVPAGPEPPPAKQALKAFEAALKLDPRLIEARLRAARIRALNDSRAVRELEQIANDRTDSPFSYLAAISRAAVAHAQRDIPGATRWFERSLELNPRSTAATIALSTLKPAPGPPFDALDSNDPYYTYACRVLTADVAQKLSDRLAVAVVK